jgi:hypothetical protein
MKLFFSLCLLLSTCVTFAETLPSSSASPAPAVSAVPPAVAQVAPPAPKVIPATPSNDPGSPAAAAPQVAVAEPSAPPAWAQEVVVAAEKLPVIGPIVSKILLYLGILGAIATATVGFLLGVLNTLMGVFNLAGLASAATKIAAFRDGKIMYWLKFISMFNAQKKPDNGATLTNS